MNVPNVVSILHHLQPNVAPIASRIGAFSFAGLVLRMSLPALRLLGVAKSESLMSLASHGKLHCICTEQKLETRSDRRQVCRSCGNEVRATDVAMLSKDLSGDEIKKHVKVLQSAANRARDIEVPETVSDVYQLHAYLDATKNPTRKSTRSASSATSQPDSRRVG
jgi:hypothetical protein